MTAQHNNEWEIFIIFTETLVKVIINQWLFIYLICFFSVCICEIVCFKCDKHKIKKKPTIYPCFPQINHPQNGYIFIFIFIFGKQINYLNNSTSGHKFYINCSVIYWLPTLFSYVTKSSRVMKQRDKHFNPLQ